MKWGGSICGKTSFFHSFSPISWYWDYFIENRLDFLEHAVTRKWFFHVIVQVVGWEHLDPNTKESATTRESYTQCHLDVGPTLQRWLGHSREVILVTLGGMRCGWMDMEVKPLDVKSKWSEMWKDMPCKPSKSCLKHITLVRMIVPAWDTKKDTLQCYIKTTYNNLYQQIKYLKKHVNA